MTPDLTALTLAGLLQCLQFLILAIPATKELGTSVTLNTRDDGPLESKVSLRLARLSRALDNHFDALILFAIAVSVVTLADKSSPFTAICAWTYLAARILYIPAYYFGWCPWRSRIWAVGWTATLCLLLAALL